MKKAFTTFLAATITIAMVSIGVLSTAPANAAPLPSASVLSAPTVGSGIPTPNEQPDSISLREPAGQYVYNCILTNGSSYTLSAGTATSSCKGSYLRRYISGVLVNNISLTGTGAVSNPNAITVDCAIALVGGVIVVLSVTGTVLWVASAAVGGISFYRACKA